jgi:hypothetical protein
VGKSMNAVEGFLLCLLENYSPKFVIWHTYGAWVPFKSSLAIFGSTI